MYSIGSERNHFAILTLFQAVPCNLLCVVLAILKRRNLCWMSKIASVHISTGVFWSEIVIESTGGTDPITSHGHRKADAQRIRGLIETYQAQSRV